VFEEACLDRAPHGGPETRVLEELEHLWGGRFLLREAWQAALASAAFEVTAIDDLTGAFLVHFGRLAAIAQTYGAAEYPAHETEAFGHAMTLANAGVIGYSRFVARRR
jgi:hypothetical protein